MTKITKVLSKILMLGFCMILFSCHIDVNHHHDHIDERYPFLGEYHAVESFYDQNTGTHESFEYDLEIVRTNDNSLEIIVTGYGNGGIYGTNCSLVGFVDGSHIEIPLNVCHYNGITDYEILGHGDLSVDGGHLTFDFDIARCEGGICHDEPLISIHAHRI
jgi:hypothetical protein